MFSRTSVSSFGEATEYFIELPDTCKNNIDTYFSYTKENGKLLCSHYGMFGKYYVHISDKFIIRINPNVYTITETTVINGVVMFRYNEIENKTEWQNVKELPYGDMCKIIDSYKYILKFIDKHFEGEINDYLKNLLNYT